MHFTICMIIRRQVCYLFSENRTPPKTIHRAKPPFKRACPRMRVPWKFNAAKIYNRRLTKLGRNYLHINTGPPAQWIQYDSPPQLPPYSKMRGKPRTHNKARKIRHTVPHPPAGRDERHLGPRVRVADTADAARGDARHRGLPRLLLAGLDDVVLECRGSWCSLQFMALELDDRRLPLLDRPDCKRKRGRVSRADPVRSIKSSVCFSDVVVGYWVIGGNGST